MPLCYLLSASICSEVNINPGIWMKPAVRCVKHGHTLRPIACWTAGQLELTFFLPLLVTTLCGKDGGVQSSCWTRRVAEQLAKDRRLLVGVLKHILIPALQSQSQDEHVRKVSRPVAWHCPLFRQLGIPCPAMFLPTYVTASRCVRCCVVLSKQIQRRGGAQDAWQADRCL